MRKLLDLYHDYYYRQYLPYRLPTGHDRIYFFHVRKTAGTSFTNMVMGAFDDTGRTPEELWSAIWSAHRHRLLIGDKIFVTGERRQIERGAYFYATSHLAAHEFSLPDNTLTVTCLRDPIERVVSHYRMLLTWQQNNSPALSKESHWLGTDFSDFLDRLPKEHLLRQVFTFSSSFDVDEAYRRICDTYFWFFSKDIIAASKTFAQRLGFNLRAPLHTNRSEVTFVPNYSERRLLEKLLEPEIELYARLEEMYAPAKRFGRIATG